MAQTFFVDEDLKASLRLDSILTGKQSRWLGGWVALFWVQALFAGEDPKHSLRPIGAASC